MTFVLTLTAYAALGAYLGASWARIERVHQANRRLIGLAYDLNTALLCSPFAGTEAPAQLAELNFRQTVIDARWVACDQNVLDGSFVWCVWKSIPRAELRAAQAIREVGNA